MRCFIVFFTVVALTVAETYDPEHDDFNIQALVSDTAALKSFLDCFIDKQPCNEVQGSFKVDLAEAVQQACAKCTAAQKYLARNFLAALQEKLPTGYTEFKNKYDPEGKYFDKFQETLANGERN